jgi:uncharacterized protein
LHANSFKKLIIFHGLNPIAAPNTPNYPWPHKRRFNAYAEFMKAKFGGRVQKISVDAGFNCPNRDGSLGLGGCTYCNNDAFNPGYCRDTPSVTKQIAEGIEFHKRRYRRAEKFLVYFQAYTNTHAGLDTLKEKYETALQQDKVIGLVIGTRPDCLPDELLQYLSSLLKQHYIMIEFGVESIYDQSLARLNRGHDFAQSQDAITRTAAAGLACGAHLIFGLPGETRIQMLHAAEEISKLPLTTIKFHQLQIFRNTPMEVQYEQNPEQFELFSLDEYIDFVIDFSERLNPDIIIERFAGEAPPNQLASIPWGKLRYDAVLQLIEKRMQQRNTWQGKNYKRPVEKKP